MNVRLKRRIFISAIGLIIVCAVIYGFIPGAVPVEVIKAARGPLRVTIEEQGKTQLKDRFVISAPVAGFLRRIDLKVADSVVKGQQIAILEPPRSQTLDPRSRAEAETSASAAQSGLSAAMEKEKAAKADADYTGLKLERLKKLYANGYIAKDTLEQAEAETKRTRAAYLSAQAAVGVARSDIDKTQAALKNFATAAGNRSQDAVAVQSPVAGRVLRIYRESEGMINAGEPIMDIGNPGIIEVRVDVLSADAVKIKKGTPVLFERWGGDTPLEGVVRVVEPAGFTKISSLGVEEQRVVVVVDITTPPQAWQQLGDGFRLDASFIIWEGKDVLHVPASALFRVGKKWAAFVVENGMARQRVVEVGQRNGLTAEILSGVKAGEEVIVHPDDAVQEGTRVERKGK